jgi:FixJ family two-component response regulator
MADQKQNIVVVDDDAEMNQALKRLLNAAGFRAVTFGSAEACLEGGMLADVACMVLDIHLPGLSGFELYRRLRQKYTATPVIFITAYDDPTSQLQAKEAGAVGYLTKPFPGQSLLTAIINALHASPGKP